MNIAAAFPFLALLLAPVALGQQFKPLFNGKDLSGWDGDPNLWRVEDGVLVGESNDSDKKVKANTFLIWKDGKLEDFDLRIKARVTGGNNSGIQYRSAMLEGRKWGLGGYQMDMHPKQEYLGMLYEERGRGIVCQRGKQVNIMANGKKQPAGDLPLQKVDLGQWNEFRIVARGNILRHFVNGKKALQVMDNQLEKRRMKGLLGLQLHAGGPMKLEVKSIELRTLKPQAPAKPKPKPEAKPKPEPAPQAARDKTADFKVAKDFKLEKLYDVPKAQGSWVSMAVLPDGKLVVSDQYGALYEVRPPAVGAARGETRVKPLPLAIGGSHGMLWHRGALYVTVNEKVKVRNGVYKVTDSDGDGALDKVEQLREVSGGGEHGLHSLVPSPDGEWIYMICGNHTKAPEMDHYWMPKNWDEDHLLPRNPDGRGHARNTMAPGGWICRFKPDNSRWELVSNGFRNPYDLAFNEHGDLFAYDADMEWDLGMPWYRPTRLCHVVPGAEWGWRNGTGKWPVYYQDSLPPVVDIGPGSPTGVLSGLGAKFPARYQKAIFLFDWTFATIHAVHLAPDGTSYSGTKEEFVAGPGLPLTDAEFGTDGAMYFVTGGRRTASALWRVTYTGRESTDPVTRDRAGSPLPELVAELGKADLAAVVGKMGSEDRFERFLARIEAERRPIAEVVRAIGPGPRPWQAITGALAVARQGSGKERPAATRWLGALAWDSLTREQRLGTLRGWALVFSRTGPPGEAERKALLAQIDSRYPAPDDDLNAELCRVLCYLQAPNVVGRTLRLMAAQKDTVWPDWAELATRNKGYGKAVLNMLRNSPPAQDIHYALCLRTVKGPWTPGQRRQIMEWYAMARSKNGGNSYKPFLDRMEKDMLANATEEERRLIAGWKFTPPPSPFANLPQPKGPGRKWTVEEVAAIGGSDLTGADPENGKRMFQASLCAACHRYEGEGGGAGPDLTAVSGRFKPRDIAEAILEPGKVISDQYEFHLIGKKDGSSVWGRVLDEKNGVLVVAVNAYDFGQTVDVPRAEVKSVEPSAVSPMPGALINRLNEDELRDLLAFLMRK